MIVFCSWRQQLHLSFFHFLLCLFMESPEQFHSNALFNVCVTQDLEWKAQTKQYYSNTDLPFTTLTSYPVGGIQNFIYPLFHTQWENEWDKNNFSLLMFGQLIFDCLLSTSILYCLPFWSKKTHHFFLANTENVRSFFLVQPLLQSISLPVE